MKTKYVTKRVKPEYADYDSPKKFVTIQSIIAKHLTAHPKAICSYSGGADSDIMLHLIEQTREVFSLPPVKYIFINTGLEMKAIIDHVKDAERLYGIEITELRPKVNIIQAAHKCGIPFVSKIMSEGFMMMQKKNIPATIVQEMRDAEDKAAKRQELRERYHGAESEINFLCSCDAQGQPWTDTPLCLDASAYMLDFILEYPIPFKVSDKCCDYCKKDVAKIAQAGYELIITGERIEEGGRRAVARKGSANSCFNETGSGQYRFRPLFFVSDRDKKWYKDYYKIRYSDAYEVYGLKRTGCCGCPISARAVADLELIKPYEPNLVKAAWRVFGDSYMYRKLYDMYRARRHKEEKLKKKQEYAKSHYYGLLVDALYEEAASLLKQNKTNLTE